MLDTQFPSKEYSLDDVVDLLINEGEKRSRVKQRILRSMAAGYMPHKHYGDKGRCMTPQMFREWDSGVDTSVYDDDGLVVPCRRCKQARLKKQVQETPKVKLLPKIN